MTTAETLNETPLIEHFKELKRRVMWSVIAFIITFVVCYNFAEEIYLFLAQPLNDAFAVDDGRRLIYTGLTEAFFTYVKLSFYAAICICFPFLAIQFYMFVSPGLYKKEKKVMMPFLILTPVLFILGASIAYYAIFPLAWKFFLGFEALGQGGTLPIQLEAKVSEYLSLVIRIIFAFGVAFQLPIFLNLLARVGLVTSDYLKRNRKYAMLILLLMAALLTPPDVISQIGLAVPLLLLYELSIFTCRSVEKKHEEDVEHA